MPAPMPRTSAAPSLGHSRPRLGLLAVLTACALIAPSAQALEPRRNGWFVTGSATRLDGADGRTKDYTLVHEMRVLPRAKTKRAVIDAEVDKRFTWRLHRALPCAAVKTSLRDGFARNAFTNTAKISQIANTCSGPTLKAGAQVVIAYAASTRTTTFWVEGMGTASVVGTDFMKAVWSLWLGNVSQPKLGESLVARL